MEGEDEEVVMVADVMFEEACACVCACVHLSARHRCSCSVRENGGLNLGSADWPIRDCFHVTCGSQFTLPQLSVPLFLSVSSLSASVYTTILSVSSSISPPFSSSHSICSLSLTNLWSTSTLPTPDLPLFSLISLL